MTKLASCLAVTTAAVLLAGCGPFTPRPHVETQQASSGEIPSEVLSQCRDFKELITACRHGDSVWWVIYRTSDPGTPERSFGFHRARGRWILSIKDNRAGNYCE